MRLSHDTQYSTCICIELHSPSIMPSLWLLELAAFSLLLSLSIRRILQVYVGIQAALCTGCWSTAYRWNGADGSGFLRIWLLFL